MLCVCHDPCSVSCVMLWTLILKWFSARCFCFHFLSLFPVSLVCLFVPIVTLVCSYDNCPRPLVISLSLSVCVLKRLGFHLWCWSLLMFPGCSWFLPDGLSERFVSSQLKLCAQVDSLSASSLRYRTTSLKMNPAAQIICLRQEERPIEDYVKDFINLAHLTSLDTVCLMIYFRGGLSEPLSLIMPLHDPHWTLDFYIDLALQLSGSPFTVGIAEEENDTPVVTSTLESRSVMADVPESSQVTAALPESSQVTANLPESSQVTAALHESRHVSALCPVSSHVTAVRSESCHFLSVASRSSRTVFQYLRLASSVEDPPLVSARAAGISKPALSNPFVPEVIPLSVAFPIWGIAFWCVWAVFTTAKVPEPATSTEGLPEVAAEAAEPPEMVVSAPNPPEVAAEPLEATFLTSAPAMVVAPINELPVCHAKVTEAAYELFSALNRLRRPSQNARLVLNPS